jgi:teichuronic acid biosynthesis glycosyltransferase TuaC
MESKGLSVLWVARGNGKGDFKPVVGNQLESLKNLQRVSLHALVLDGNGIFAYLKSFFQIRSAVKRNHIDIIHAHYSLTAFVCALTFSAPVVVSLMGSDVIANSWRRRIIVLFSRLFWRKVIVKTEQMKQLIGIEEALVIPNGVDMDFFFPLDSEEFKRKLSWDYSKYHIVFPSNRLRSEKNFQLLADAILLLNRTDIEVHEMKGLTKEEVRQYYAASDLVVMTSLREGSPNAIKEALSMNKCVISTSVGDVVELTSGVDGAWIVSFDPKDLAECIHHVFVRGVLQSNGRLAIERLSSTKVASTLEDVYISVS